MGIPYLNIGNDNCLSPGHFFNDEMKSSKTNTFPQIIDILVLPPGKPVFILK